MKEHCSLLFDSLCLSPLPSLICSCVSAGSNHCYSTRQHQMRGTETPKKSIGNILPESNGPSALAQKSSWFRQFSRWRFCYRPSFSWSSRSSSYSPVRSGRQTCRRVDLYQRWLPHLCSPFCKGYWEFPRRFLPLSAASSFSWSSIAYPVSLSAPCDDDDQQRVLNSPPTLNAI